MNKENYNIMKKLVLSLANDWNCPNSYLEEITGLSWTQYQALRNILEEEE